MTLGGRATELQRALPSEVQSELERLLMSVTGASLLVAGDVAEADAASLVDRVQQELEPFLRLRGPVDSVDSSGRERLQIDFEEELASWGGLLYKPSFASALSLNACYDPGVARTLDQCGTI